MFVLDSMVVTMHKLWTIVNGFKSDMRIGELAKQTSVSRDTIRFYERHGLITSRPSVSSSNNYRIYPKDAALTLELIREAQAAGFTLAELRLFIATLQNSSDPDFDSDTFLEEKINEVERTIDRSMRFLQTLKLTRDALNVSG